MTDSWETIYVIEETQCPTCRFRKDETVDGQHAVDYPMCYEIEAELVLEKDLPEGLDEDEFGAVVCTKYRTGDPAETFGVHPDQPSLF